MSTLIILMQKKQIFKDRYCSDMARMARQQLALMNKCRMRKTGGKGVARSATSGDACLSKNHPFYVQFINR
ncbi:MAG: hypothetical protein IJ540_04345 [Prevotella sp.]|nr:hypothetical protein [Prevotella sp.]